MEPFVVVDPRFRHVVDGSRPVSAGDVAFDAADLT